MASVSTPSHLNEVRLRGRLADAPAYRQMPSGDLLATFRVTVSRPPDERGVDSVDCVSARSTVRAALETAVAGDTLDIDGALRRRFWRSTTGTASRYAVDVSVLRVTPTGPRVAGSPDQTPV